MTLARTVGSLFRAPLVRSRSASASKNMSVEMASFPSSSASATPTRPRGYSRTAIAIPPSPPLASAPCFIRQPSATALAAAPQWATHRGYASDKGKMELYSDEGGATGAGTDDVAHTDAAFDNSKTNPDEAAKGVQNETGKDFTQRSPANEEYSQPKKGEQGKEVPLNTSKVEKEKK